MQEFLSMGASGDAIFAGRECKKREHCAELNAPFSRHLKGDADWLLNMAIDEASYARCNPLKPRPTNWCFAC
jgi:hypothetical protein